MKRTGLMIVAIMIFILAQVAQADWTATKRLTWTSGSSYDPAIAIDSNDTVHVIWDDDTPGNVEIYYRKGK